MAKERKKNSSDYEFQNLWYLIPVILRHADQIVCAEKVMNMQLVPVYKDILEVHPAVSLSV